MNGRKYLPATSDREQVLTIVKGFKNKETKKKGHSKIGLVVEKSSQKNWKK